MIRLWEEYATEKELNEYDRLYKDYNDRLEVFSDFVTEAIGTLGIDPGPRDVNSFNFDPFSHEIDRGLDDSYLGHLVSLIREYKAPKDLEATRLDIMLKIESMTAGHMRECLLPMAYIVDNCYKRYQDSIGGDKQALIRDAKRLVASVEEDLQKVIQDFERWQDYESIPQEIESRVFYVGGDFSALLNAAEFWHIEGMEKELQIIAETAAGNYKKAAAEARARGPKRKEPPRGTPLEQPLPEEDKAAPARSIADIKKSDVFWTLNSKLYNKYTTIQSQLLKVESNGQLVMFAEEQPLRVSPKKAPDVITLVSLAYDGELSPKLARLTAYDKEILNTVCSICHVGNRIITISDIYRVMNGNTTKQPSPAALTKIEASLRKLNQTTIYIDFTDEINKNYIVLDDDTDERFIKGTVEGRLLEFMFFTGETNRGRTIKAIEILCPPILYYYSKMKNGLLPIPAQMLNTQSISATDDVIVIRAYLAKQVVLLKEKKRNNNKILYSTLLEECTIELPAEGQEQANYMARKRKDIGKILDEWQKNGYIKGYQEEKTGKKYTGVTISV